MVPWQGGHASRSTSKICCRSAAHRRVASVGASRGAATIGSGGLRSATHAARAVGILAVNFGFALRATPGNVGLFQPAYAATAVAFGLNENQTIAVAFLIQVQQILPVTLLGVALAPEFIFKQKKRRADDAPGEIPSESRREGERRELL